MSKRVSIALLLLVSASAGAQRRGAVTADKMVTNDGRTAEEMTKRYGQYIEAFRTQNIQALEGLVAPDFVLVGMPKGMTARQMTDKFFRQLGGGPDDHVAILQVLRRGNEVTAMIDHYIVVDIDDRPAVPLRWRHIWIQSRQGWKLKRAQNLPGTQASGQAGGRNGR